MLPKKGPRPRNSQHANGPPWLAKSAGLARDAVMGLFPFAEVVPSVCLLVSTRPKSRRRHGTTSRLRISEFDFMASSRPQLTDLPSMIRSWRDRLKELEREEQLAAANGDTSGAGTVREVDIEAVGQSAPVPAPARAPIRAPTLSGPTRHDHGQGAPSIVDEPSLLQHSETPPERPSSNGRPSPVVVSKKGHLEPAGVERLMRPIDQALTHNQTPVYRYANTTSTAAPFCSCDALLASGQWSLPLRRQADELVRVYFTRVHRMYPILHQPTFAKQYQRL